MKSFRLATSVTINKYKDFRLRGEILASSFKYFTLLTRIDAGGLIDFRLRAGVYDSSNMRFVSQGVTLRVAERFKLTAKIRETNSTKSFSLISRVKINNFESNTLVSRIGISKVSSFKLKVRVSKARFVWLRLKSLTRKRGFVFTLLKSSVTKMGREYSTYFMLKNSTSTFMPSVSRIRDFDGLASVWAKLTVTNENIPPIRGVELSFSIDELAVIPSLLSDSYPFVKAPLREFTGIRGFVSTSVVSVRRDFDGILSPYIQLTGTFSTLTPLRSNAIFFSISREIVDFQLNDVTALSLNLVMTKLDTRIPETQMSINFGQNLFKVSFSRFRRIINPFVDKEEDKSFFCSPYQQRFLITYEPNTYHLEEVTVSNISPEIDETFLPFKIKGRSVPEIFFGERTARRVRIKKETNMRGFITHDVPEIRGKISTLDSFHCENAAEDITNTIGSHSAQNNGERLTIKGLSLITPSFFMIKTGLYDPAVVYPTGETITVETVQEDANGVPIGVEYHDYTAFNGVSQIYPLASFQIETERFNADGVSCIVPFSTVWVAREAIIEPLIQPLRLYARVRINADGLQSSKQNFTAVFTTDIEGSLSAKSRFTANLWDNLSPLRYELNLRIAV